jgi:hypothetical protein
MKNALIIGGGIFAGLVILVFLTYIGIIVYINWPSDRPIAKDVRVSQEWIEIQIDPPLKPSHRSQSVNLRIAEFQHDHNSNSSFDIRLPDGSVIAPEIELYEEDGNRFAMRHGGFSSKIYEDIVFRLSHDLPADRSFTKVRIRSEVPFACEQIYWRDYDPK